MPFDTGLVEIPSADNSGEVPPDMPGGNQPDGSMPADDSMPSDGSMPADGGLIIADTAMFMKSETQACLTVNDAAVITSVLTGESAAASLSDITSGSFLLLTLDEDGNISSIQIISAVLMDSANPGNDDGVVRVEDPTT